METDTKQPAATGGCSARPACSTCRFWHTDEPDDEEGICRRNPPHVAGGSFGFTNQLFGLIWRSSGTEWPETNKDDWCGEYQQGRSNGECSDGV